MSIYTIGQTARLDLGPVTDTESGVAYDPDPLTLTAYQPDGTEAHAWTYGTDPEIVRDGIGEFHANVPLDEGGMWRAVWAWGEDDEIGESNVQLWVQDAAAFATVAQVAQRMGRTLTSAEEAQAGQLLADATSLIADAVGQDDDWAASLDPIPARLRVTCIEVAVRVLQNPLGVHSQTERLGEYQRSHTYPGTDAASLYLTADEERKCRRAVTGSLFAAVTLEGPYSGDVEDDLELLLES